MSPRRPLFVPAEPDAGAIHLRFDEALIEARPGDSLATALLAAGELMTSRSPKYRRPRGPYCLGGDCGTCLVRVDGRPNVRACMTAVREGMRASSQNSYRPRRLDPTALVDKLFPGGIDHHHLMVKPRLANQVMQEFARNLTGFGELPEGVAEREHEYLAHELPVLIIGAGPAGRAAAAVFETTGVAHLIVDRFDARQLEANFPTPDAPGSDAPGSGVHRLPRELLSDTSVFAVYPGPRAVFPEHRDALALVAASQRDGGVERLHDIRPRHLLLCMGSRDPMLPFVNDDLPGIVAARGLVRALRRARARLDCACVVVGEGAWARTLRDELDALRAPGAPALELITPEQVERAVGRERVEGLICAGRRLPCELVALAAPPAPAHELAAQAGVALRFDGAGFVVERYATAAAARGTESTESTKASEGPTGSCGRLGGTQLWAAGDLCGWIGPQAAARDGEAVAKAVLEALAAAPGAAHDARRYAAAAPPQPPAMRERAVVGDHFGEEDPP